MTDESYQLPIGSGDRWADDYERGRPGWPPEIFDLIDLSSHATVLDLGAGTGKLTRLLVPRFDHVIAAEPQEAMRRLLTTLCPTAKIAEGTAEAIQLGAEWVDGVFVAEAFHKFDDERSLAEIARVMRPPGVLVLMWNVPAGPTEPSIAAVKRLVDQMLAARGLSEGELGYDPMDLNTRRFASGAWRQGFAGSRFEELREARVRHTQMLDREGMVAFLASMGWIADLSDDERLPLLDDVGSLLTNHQYRRPWETRLFWTRLKDGGG
jgi:SAM-dependent methyltransferase